MDFIGVLLLACIGVSMTSVGWYMWTVTSRLPALAFAACGVALITLGFIAAWGGIL